MLSLVYDQRNKSVPFFYYVIKLTELVGHSLIQSLFLTHHYYRLLNNIQHSLSLFICVAQF